MARLEPFRNNEFNELVNRIAKLHDRLNRLEKQFSIKEETVNGLTTITETYDFKKCWVQTNRFHDADHITYVRIKDKQIESDKIYIDNLDWLKESVIYENFKEDNLNTNIIPNILYAIKDTNNKINNNE